MYCPVDGAVRTLRAKQKADSTSGQVGILYVSLLQYYWIVPILSNRWCCVYLVGKAESWLHIWAHVCLLLLYNSYTVRLIVCVPCGESRKLTPHLDTYLTAWYPWWAAPPSSSPPPRAALRTCTRWRRSSSFGFNLLLQFCGSGSGMKLDTKPDFPLQDPDPTKCAMYCTLHAFTPNIHCLILWMYSHCLWDTCVPQWESATLAPLK